MTRGQRESSAARCCTERLRTPKAPDRNVPCPRWKRRKLPCFVASLCELAALRQRQSLARFATEVFLTSLSSFMYSVARGEVASVYTAMCQDNGTTVSELSRCCNMYSFPAKSLSAYQDLPESNFLGRSPRGTSSLTTSWPECGGQHMQDMSIYYTII